MKNMNNKRIEELKKRPFAKIFPEAMNNIEDGFCSTCGGGIITDRYYFKDKLSKKEFNISGMCQACQDSVFGGK